MADNNNLSNSAARVQRALEACGLPLHVTELSAVGTPHALFNLTPGDLARACGGRVADVAPD